MFAVGRQPRVEVARHWRCNRLGAAVAAIGGLVWAVVLVTDGIESCGGDPAASAGALQGEGRFPVHVIGFGLSGAENADLDSLRAIADASGGRFITAGNARELRDALAPGAAGPACSSAVPAGSVNVPLAEVG